MRLHHHCTPGTNAAYRNCYLGVVPIMFDRLFGTLHSERPDEPARHGLAHPSGTQNPLRLVCLPWRRLIADMRAAGSVGGALRVALGRP